MKSFQHHWSRQLLILLCLLLVLPFYFGCSGGGTSGTGLGETAGAIDQADSGVCGDTVCEAGSFCSYPMGSCGNNGEAGTCTVAPEICTLIFHPFCGCDGNTYGNECEAASQRVSIDYDGECIKP